MLGRFSAAFGIIEMFILKKVFSTSCLTEKCNEILALYPPGLKTFDDCIKTAVATKNAAPFVERFKKCYTVDMLLTKEMKNPAVSEAYSTSSKEYVKLAMNHGKNIENGKFDWVEFNNDRKKIDEVLYSKLKELFP